MKMMKNILIILLSLFTNEANAYLSTPSSGGGGGGVWGSIIGTLGDQTDLVSEFLLKQNVRIINTVVTTFTIPTLNSDYILNADTSGGAFVITLPDASIAGTNCIDIKNIGSPVNNATIDGLGAQTIDNNLTFVETDMNESVRLCPSTGNWKLY